VFGTVPTTGTDIKVDLTGVFYPENYWSNNLQVTDVTVDSTVTPRVAWNGTFKETTGYGTFALPYQKDIYERPASLDLVAGSYSGIVIHDDYLDPIGYTMTLAISASGALSGNDTRGCQYAATSPCRGRIATTMA